MIQSTRFKRKIDTATQQAKTGGTYSLIQTQQIFATRPFVRLCGYYLPDNFDFLMSQRGSTRVRNAQNESAQ